MCLSNLALLPQKQKNFPNHSFFQVFCASAFWLLKLVLPTWQNAFSYSPLSQLGRAEDRWWRKYENIGKNGTKSRKAAFVERYHFAKITNHPPKAISRPMRFAWRRRYYFAVNRCYLHFFRHCLLIQNVIQQQIRSVHLDTIIQNNSIGKSPKMSQLNFPILGAFWFIRIHFW